MAKDKLIVVHHPGFWRIFRASPEMLGLLRLGDVIPTPAGEWCEDPAADHIFSRPDAEASIIAVSPPRDDEWERLPEIVARASTKEVQQDLLIWPGTSCILSASTELSKGRD